MNNATVGAAIRLAVELLVLLAVVQFVLLPTLTERFRQRMFEIRRRLFVFMANGGIRPDDIAYVRLRSTTNSMLRYAERVWLVKALVMAVVFRREVAAHQARVRADLASADGGRARERILLFKREIDDAVADHLIATSFVAWVLVAVATIVVTLRMVVRGVARAQNVAQHPVRGEFSDAMREHVPVASIEVDAEAFEDCAAAAT